MTSKENKDYLQDKIATIESAISDTKNTPNIVTNAMRVYEASDKLQKAIRNLLLALSGAKPDETGLVGLKVRDETIKDFTSINRNHMYPLYAVIFGFDENRYFVLNQTAVLITPSRGFDEFIDEISIDKLPSHGVAIITSIKPDGFKHNSTVGFCKEGNDQYINIGSEQLYSNEIYELLCTVLGEGLWRIGNPTLWEYALVFNIHTWPISAEHDITTNEGVQNDNS